MPSPSPTAAPVTILVDADACPVKDEIYRVAERFGAEVRVVSNSPFRVPVSARVKRVVVSDGFDAADDWIAEHADARSVVITADIPLAARCLSRSARVVGPSGRRFTEDGIGAALTMRDLKSHLRDSGEIRDHDPPFTKQDRSRFLQALEQAVQAAKKS